jgi:hypothetical protein
MARDPVDPGIQSVPGHYFPQDPFISMVLMSVPLVMIVMLVMAFTMVMAGVVALPVSRYILIVVPVIAHKVDRPTARVVLRAMLAPVFLVARRHMQVDWRR